MLRPRANLRCFGSSNKNSPWRVTVGQQQIYVSNDLLGISKFKFTGIIMRSIGLYLNIACFVLGCGQPEVKEGFKAELHDNPYSLVYQSVQRVRFSTYAFSPKLSNLRNQNMILEKIKLAWMITQSRVFHLVLAQELLRVFSKKQMKG